MNLGMMRRPMGNVDLSYLRPAQDQRARINEAIGMAQKIREMNAQRMQPPQTGPMPDRLPPPTPRQLKGLGPQTQPGLSPQVMPEVAPQGGAQGHTPPDISALLQMIAQMKGAQQPPQTVQPQSGQFSVYGGWPSAMPQRFTR